MPKLCSSTADDAIEFTPFEDLMAACERVTTFYGLLNTVLLSFGILLELSLAFGDRTGLIFMNKLLLYGY